MNRIGNDELEKWGQEEIEKKKWNKDIHALELV